MGDPNLTRMHAVCEALVRQLIIPRPFDIGVFCQVLTARRGRLLRLLPLPVPAGDCVPSGMWVETDTEDIIFYQKATSRLHRDLIILHELAHLLLGHRSTPTADAVWLDRALPDLDADMVRAILTRHMCSTEQEQQATS